MFKKFLFQKPIILIGVIFLISFSIFSSFYKDTFADDTVNYLEISTNDSTKFSYNGSDVVLNGVNVNNLGALGIWQAANINNIEVGPGDYEKIAEMGANHVRFGISYQWYLNNPTNFYNVIDNHVSWARQNNLWFIPVIFTLPYLNENTNDSLAHAQGGCYQGYNNPCNFWSNTQAAVDAREDFKDFWIEFVSRYSDDNTVAGYDLLNEPWSLDESFNRYIFAINYFTEIITAIIDGNHNSTQLFFLESEPEPLSPVIYESYSTGVTKLNNLKTITNNRIVWSTHMYEPFTLTHGSQVTYPTDEDGVTWDSNTMANPTSPDAHPGSIIQELRSGQSVVINGETYTNYSDYITDYPHDIRNRFAISFANEDLNIPIYIGEWSAKQTPDEDGTGWYSDTFLDYNSDISNLFDTWGASNSVFEFKAGHENWGLFKEDGPQPYGSFEEDVSYNRDTPSETVQPFIDTLENIWSSNVVPDFVTIAAAECQNGIIEGSEQCDDGNNVNGDGCSLTCSIEKQGPTISGARNICTVSSSLSDFRFDAYHRISTASYTNPASIPADSGYTFASNSVRLGNDGTNYYIPYLWFESVNLPANSNVSTAYIEFNAAGNATPSALTANIQGLKVAGNLRTYDPDASSANRYFVDRNPYSTYLGGANWVHWGAYATSSSSSPFVGFPHDTLARNNGAVYQWARTTASSSWDLGTNAITAGDSIPTTNIASVINELTTQAGWASGNDLGIIFIPQLGDSSSARVFYGYDATISTSLNNYSFTPTNNDATRFASLYANCSEYVSGLNAVNDNFTSRFNEDISGDVTEDNGNGADLNPGTYNLSYSVIRDVENGSLTFQSNGTFTYTPNLGYSGTDSFSYVVSDGNGGTDNAAVTFSIIGNSYPIVNAEVITDGRVNDPFTLSADAVDNDGTITSYLWSKVSGPGNVVFSSSSSSTTQAIFSQPGAYQISVRVEDNDNGFTVSDLFINVEDNIPIDNDEEDPDDETSNDSTGNSGSDNQSSNTDNETDEEDIVSYPNSYVSGEIPLTPTNNPGSNKPEENESPEQSDNTVTNVIVIGVGLTAATSAGYFLLRRRTFR